MATTPSAGATSGKSGAVKPATQTKTVNKVETAQGSSGTAAAPKAKTNRVSTSGATDLSSGDLTAAITEAYNAGVSDQAAADSANTSSGSSSGGSSSSGSSSSGSSSSGILSSITSNYKVLLIAAGVAGIGFYLYRRNKSGKPLFPSKQNPFSSSSTSTMESE